METGPIDLVIFDCDGVLVDSETIGNQAFTDALNEHGIPATFDEVIEHFLGKSIAQSLDLITELWGKPVPEPFFEKYKARRNAALQNGLKPVKHIEAVLDSLEYPYCLASNGSHEKMKISLAVTGLAHRFVDKRFSVDDVERGKPAPDVFLFAAKSFGVAPERCVVIEDTHTGVEAARAAGMRVFAYCALTPGKRLFDAGATTLFNNMLELPSLLERSALGMC